MAIIVVLYGNGICYNLNNSLIYLIPFLVGSCCLLRNQSKFGITTSKKIKVYLCCDRDAKNDLKSCKDARDCEKKKNKKPQIVG